MKDFIKFTFFFFLFQFSYTQCKDSIQIPYSDGSFSKYTGCLDDEGRPSGEGIESYKDMIYQGNWKKGELNGFGKWIRTELNSKYEGEWVNGKIVNGNFYKKSDEFELFYEGGFDEFKFYGKGVLKTMSVDVNIIEKGDFFANRLFDGTSKEIYKSGLIKVKKIKKGKALEVKRNDRNYYNKNDIIGDSSYSEVTLKKEGDESVGISYKIEMKINGVSGEWIFDTGAQLFSIGKRMFKRLEDQGIEYKNLNKTVQTFGVGGVSSGDVIIIDEISIGDYKVKNLVTTVSKDNNFSLLGMGFLNKFSDVHWNMKDEKIILYK